MVKPEGNKKVVFSDFLLHQSAARLLFLPDIYLWVCKFPFWKNLVSTACWSGGSVPAASSHNRWIWTLLKSWRPKLQNFSEINPFSLRARPVSSGRWSCLSCYEVVLKSPPSLCLLETRRINQRMSGYQQFSIQRQDRIIFLNASQVL